MTEPSRPTVNGRHAAILFAILAVFYGVTEWWVGSFRGPFEFDPDYAYLLNGLDIAVLKAPYLVEHPGTPAEILISFVLAATWILTQLQHGASNIKDEVLRNPVFYLNVVNSVFMALSAAALFYFCRAVRAATNMFWAAALGALTLFISHAAMSCLHRVMPEQIQIAASLVLAGLLAPLAFQKKKETASRLRIAAIGVALAIAITAKITAAPLLLCFIMLRTAAERKTAAIAFAVSSLVIIAPTLSRLPTIIGFYLSAIAGVNISPGAHVVTIVYPPPFWTSLYGLFLGAPESFVFPICYLAILLAHWSGAVRVADGVARLLAVASAAGLVLVLLVARRPELIHLSPVLGLYCLANSAIVWELSKAKRHAAIMAGACAITVCLLAFFEQRQFAEKSLADATHQQQFFARMNSSGCFVVPYYRANLVPYALYFGNQWAGGNFSDHLNSIYPDFITYDPPAKKFRGFQDLLTFRQALERFSKEKCVYFEGDQLAKDSDMGVPKEALEQIASSPDTVAVYRLRRDWIKENLR